MNYIDIQKDNGLEKLAYYIPAAGLSPETGSLIRGADLDFDYSVLIKEAFADQENRMFPIYSPEETALSAIYINQQKEDVPNIVKEACQSALDEWGIRHIKIEEDLQKEAAAVDFGETMLLPSLGKLPAVELPMLIKSAAILSGNFDNLSTVQKVEGSVQLKKFAMKHGVSMSEFDPRFNVYGLDAKCDLAKLSAEITERMASTEDMDIRDEYQTLLSKMGEYSRDIGQMVSDDKGVNTSIAYELLELDKTAGLSPHFDAIKDTFNTISYEEAGGLQKVASDSSEELEEIRIGGYDIPLVKIASIPEDIASNIMGGFSTDIVENGGINIERLENTVREIPFSAQNEIAQMILQA